MAELRLGIEKFELAQKKNGCLPSKVGLGRLGIFKLSFEVFQNLNRHMSFSWKNMLQTCFKAVFRGMRYVAGVRLNFSAPLKCGPS